MAGTVVMFSGQGSQCPRMGETLFSSDPAYREALFRADRVVRDMGAPPLVSTIFAERSDWLENLVVTHPAILATEWATWRHHIESGGAVDAVLGVSLGEYAALAAAGVYPIEALLRLAARQARLAMELMPPGGLLTVLGDKAMLEREPALFAGCTLAGTGYDGHFTVSGDEPAISRCASALAARGAVAVRLPVARAFHSPTVNALESMFRQALLELPAPQPAQFPVYSSALGGRLANPGPEHLWALVRGGMALPETVAAVEREMPDPLLVDAGPSGTLATLVSYDRPSRKGRIRYLLGRGRAANVVHEQAIGVS